MCHLGASKPPKSYGFTLSDRTAKAAGRDRGRTEQLWIKAAILQNQAVKLRRLRKAELAPRKIMGFINNLGKDFKGYGGDCRKVADNNKEV